MKILPTIIFEIASGDTYDYHSIPFFYIQFLLFLNMASATAKAARQLQKRNTILSQKTTFRRVKLLDLMKMEPDRIRTIRQRLQLTQEDFAHLIGVTFSTVNRWENGKSAPNRIAIRLLQGLEKKAKAQ